MRPLREEQGDDPVRTDRVQPEHRLVGAAGAEQADEAGDELQR